MKSHEQMQGEKDTERMDRCIGGHRLWSDTPDPYDGMFL